MNSIEIITVWVDDLLLFTKYKDQMNNLKWELGKLFKITDLGELNKLVGIEIDQDRQNGTLKIKQTKYIEAILERYGMHNANPVTILLDPNVKLQPHKPDNHMPMTNGNYALITGSLMYTTIGTWPDIAYAMNKLCSFNVNPDLVHWGATKRVLKYLKGTKTLEITYKRGGANPNRLYGYADVSFTSETDVKSISRYSFILNGGTITWSSWKQKGMVALSTPKAEYTAMAEASWGIMWLRNLYHKIGYTQNEPTLLYGDNQLVLTIVTNLQYHNRSRYFALDKHFIRKMIQMGATRLEYCCMDDMIADVLTKALPHEKHTQHTKHLGLTEAWGEVLWHKPQMAEYHNIVYYRDCTVFTSNRVYTYIRPSSLGA